MGRRVQAARWSQRGGHQGTHRSYRPLPPVDSAAPGLTFAYLPYVSVAALLLSPAPVPLEAVPAAPRMDPARGDPYRSSKGRPCPHPGYPLICRLIRWASPRVISWLPHVPEQRGRGYRRDYGSRRTDLNEYPRTSVRRWHCDDDGQNRQAQEPCNVLSHR